MIRGINTFKPIIHKTLFLTPKLNPSVVRNAGIDKVATKLEQENWNEIYRLPLIRLASAFNRLKIYQTLVTAVGTPIVFTLGEAGHLDPNSCIVFASLGITGVLTLTLCSFPIRNFVGFVYMNDGENKVKLGYVDFWGRRQNKELVIDEILSEWELPPRRINVYQRIKSRVDASVSFKLLYRYGVIRDPQRYVSVFGDDNK